MLAGEVSRKRPRADISWWPAIEHDAAPREMPLKRRRAEISSSSSSEMAGKKNRGSSSMEIDEDLHSRHLALYGRETMRKLFASSVLVSGLNGLGAEIAKNLVLAGVKLITLHDERTVEMWDLSSNFFFSVEDIGKNRALACVQKLQELNSAVTISTLTGSLSTENLSNFQAVVFTDISLEKAFVYDDFCHRHQPPIAFIKSEVRGLFGSVFCDFGPDFMVHDVDGEEPHTGIIASISNDNPALVSCVDDKWLEFQDGDLVVFSEVQGMTELNDGKPRKVKSSMPHSFSFDEDTTNFGQYVKGGIVTQVKQPKVLHFKALKDALTDPGDFLLSDFSKFDRAPMLHLAFQALDMFWQEGGRFPIAGDEEDSEKLIYLAVLINETSVDNKLEEIDKKLLRHFASGSKAVLNPMAAMFGGIVGQEVLKACSGKFHPLFQFFYFDSVESLPTEPLELDDLKPLNCRYDAQISVFGSKLQRKLEEANVFIVGSGSLGCEYLKNLALMGVSCSHKGKLSITDDDVIEKNNLSRQFLFRDWNIGQYKSTVAAAAASSINPSLQIEAFQRQANAETEHVFNDAFWDRLNVVINALDNIEARIYVDMRCLYYQKPLLESGTVGLKYNTQMIIPHMTENYGASQDPPEKQMPACTVYYFPHNIDHCLTWARSMFEGLFEETPNEVNNFLSDPDKYTSMIYSRSDCARLLFERILVCLDDERCSTFLDCVIWARRRFENFFVTRIKQLTYSYPEGATTSTGVPFWSAPKRFPHPLVFSASDTSHLNFVMAASILRAESFGISIPDWAKNPKKLADTVDRVSVPDFLPNESFEIVSNYSGEFQSLTSDLTNSFLNKLRLCIQSLPPGFRMNPIQLKKDDDRNYHMDLIVGLANMRARNYSIPAVDKLKAKLVVGRIIPAIATSMAMATGLACLELYKVIAGGHKLEDYRNTFANLALPFFSMAVPVTPKVMKHRDMSWSVWDKWTYKGNPTLRELVQWLEYKGLKPDAISCRTSLLYCSSLPIFRDRMDEKALDLAKKVINAPSHCPKLDLEVVCENNDGNIIHIPLVTIYSP